MFSSGPGLWNDGPIQGVGLTVANAWSLIPPLYAATSFIRPTQVDVDIGALVENAKILRGLAGTALYAVVKADAYGHGAVAVASALQAAGQVAGFAVSLVEEGSQLRAAGIRAPILVMGPALDGGYGELVGRHMTAMVSDTADIEHLAEIGRRRGRPVAIHLKVDTGMGRLGLPFDEVGTAVRAAIAQGGVIIEGMATHFACADSDEPSDRDCMTYAQLARFDQAVAAARAAGAEPTVLHTANSSATVLFQAARKDLVRCGLALYGNGPWAERLGLRQAMRLSTHIAQLRIVEVGATVSYGALWTAPRRSTLAVLPVGYADGVPRALTGKAEVLIDGNRCPLVGAVSMDISIADVTSLIDAGRALAVGQEVVVLGGQGTAAIATGEFARHAGLTEYEVTCGMSKRVPRVYQ